MSQFVGRTVAVDTSPFMHYVERRSQYLPELTEFFGLVATGEIRVVTSVIAYLECVVKPLRDDRPDAVKAFHRLLFHGDGIESVMVNETISHVAASLRAQRHVKTPDSIHMATALARGARFFLTHDKRLRSFGNVIVVTLDDLRQSES